MTDYETEYRVNPVGVRRYAIFDNGREVIIDEWDCLCGLIKCTSYPLEDREEFARGLAELWANTVSELASVEA